MSTATSIISSGSDKLDAWTRRSQPKIEIHLAGQTPGHVNSYTTGESIDGSITVTVDHETRFDEIEIAFEGVSRTTVERASCPGRTGSQQMFLKLRQPIDEMEYPTPRVLESGRSYEYPFTFVVPDCLLPQVCTHAKKNAHIQRSHTMLPPTLGDPILASNGKTLLDDMAPSMSQIAYTVRASVLQKQLTGHGVVAIAAIAKKVRIIPTVEEEPPVEISGSPSLCTRKEKSVKRGTLRGKLGRIVASSSQPKPIQLLPPAGEPTDTVSTVATVNLRFDPVGDEQPPPTWNNDQQTARQHILQCGPMGGLPFHDRHALCPYWMRPLHRKRTSNDHVCRIGPVDQAIVSRRLDAPRLHRLIIIIIRFINWAILRILRRHLLHRISRRPSHVAQVESLRPDFPFLLDVSRVCPRSLLDIPHPGSQPHDTDNLLRLPVQFTSQAKCAEPIKTTLGVTVTQQELEEFFHPRNVTSPTDFSTHTRSDVVDVGLAPPEYSERLSAVRASR
ncbi:hypothetical protein N7519_004757 [Penicillium mononematosum]|uniref:uncharacterized protein n=1 Tax=Penicillium mononematosum TaxID=268346 RepID=UPI002546FEFD|nr:uncharacterized protein N7519_004757 [Penicillium mononematosum]KAJ6189849.1 hypothetical protein N7519_004757 [Penicillium mononematosum]